MRLFIAEKPSLARAIADALPGPQTRRRDFIECGREDVVAWCAGHILELAEPDHYDPKFKAWRLDQLTIVPTEWRLTPTAPDLLRTIRTLLPRASRGAEQYERDLRASLLAGTYGKKEAPTFQEFVSERWLSTYPKSVGNRPTSIREKEIHVRVHLLPVLGRLRLDRISGEVVARLFARLRTKLPDKKALAEKTIKNVRATLRRILASAKEWGEIPAIPDLPRVKVPESSWDFFTWEETERLLAACRDEEERALLMSAVHTGARAGEQLTLAWGDLDWHNHLVVFRRSSTRGIVGPTKSGRERKVPLTAKLEAALRRIKHLRSDRVFCNPDGSVLTLDQLHERFWMVSRRAGLRRLRWHDLRHSFGSQAAMAGVPIIQVQQWMGHSTIAMTMRYAHLSPGAVADWIRMLEAPANQRHSDGTSRIANQKAPVTTLS